MGMSRGIRVAAAAVALGAVACTSSSSTNGPAGDAAPTPAATRAATAAAATALAGKACTILMTPPIYSAAAVTKASEAAALDKRWEALVPAFSDLERQGKGQIGVGGPALVKADQLCRQVGVPVRFASPRA